MKRIGIIGSRTRNSPEDYELLCKVFLELYEDGDPIVSGGCQTGGDFFAEQIAEDLFYHVQRSSAGEEFLTEPYVMHVHRPDYDKHSKYWSKYDPSMPEKVMATKALYERNEWIARDSDVLISLKNQSKNGGAEYTVRAAREFQRRGHQKSIIEI